MGQVGGGGGITEEQLNAALAPLAKKTEMPTLVSKQTGWASYSDGQYTSGSPFALLANTDTVLPNNAAVVVDHQKPDDVASFYSGGKITGRNGDSAVVTLDLVAVPNGVGSTLLEIWFNIGGSVGQLYRRSITFPKGNGVPLAVNFSVFVYTLDTWQANGATVYVRGNGDFSIYGIRYVIGRMHKARSS